MAGGATHLRDGIAASETMGSRTFISWSAGRHSLARSRNLPGYLKGHTSELESAQEVVGVHVTADLFDASHDLVGSAGRSGKVHGMLPWAWPVAAA
jgi:hypothetical protein